MSNEGADDLRGELAVVAASLRAYLEWQQDTGATGIPRRQRTGETHAMPPEAEVQSAPAPSVMPAPEPRPVAVARALYTDPDPGVSRPAAPEPSLFLEPAAPEPRATEAAPSPQSASVPRALPLVEQDVRVCTKCELAKTRTHTAFARGNPEASLCFVGEGPGADEDAQGIPFVGRAGQLLDRMIKAMGLDPERDTYICNIVKCRPPGNRRPEPAEIAACMPYLHEQLAVVKPKVIVALGNTAVIALLQTKLGITKVRGTWKLYRGRIPIMPTYHPSYLLRPSAQQAEAKRQAWEDLQAVMRELGLPGKSG